MSEDEFYEMMRGFSSSISEPSSKISSEVIAECFYETYRRLQPDYYHCDFDESWENVHENTKQLMTAIADEVAKRFVNGHSK